jgi:predicted porin
LEKLSMKKTLIALAAVVATGAAFAQSSVTMYGVADISVGDDNAAGTKFRAFANGMMNNGNSRLGVRGTEDLGGGLKASFTFEQGINLANGANDAPTTWHRAAWMELSGGFGAVRAGRSLSPSFHGIASWELTGAANYSAVANQFGYGAGSRNNAMIAYTTPNMGGLTATLGTILSGNDASPAAGNQSKYDLNVIYKAGPVAAALTYGKVQGEKAAWSLGGSYNLGVATVAASFQDPSDARKGFTIGAKAKAGPVDLTFDIARDTGSAVKSTDFVLEALYPLSKRTFAYGAFYRDGGAKINSYAVGVRHNF